ncbi:hypothetical protein V2H77_06715 [Photorhabdus sp. P32]|uniref:hypothetical protein n=1 Tax=Photorhabdus sp. P32 TaxID=3117549 RepID=UPI00311AD6B8
MSKLRIDRLIIRTDTTDGMYGIELNFKLGLNIISAENSFGKSTCIQSIIFALGLEGALGPSRNNPLKSVLTTKLRNDNDVEIPVKESKIYLQISNEAGDTITLLRKSDVEASKVVSVFNGAFDTINSSNFTDYFLKDPGSAKRERGFHHYLSDFLGINQPQVIKYDGSKCQLYLESIFSVNYVEQTRGWGGILNVIPTYLGIKDLSQNIIEYTLDLDVREIRRKREVCLDDKKNLEAKWGNTLAELESNAKVYGFFVSARIPDKITAKSHIYQDSDLYTFDDDNNEVSLPLKIALLEAQLNELRAKLRDSSVDDNSGVDLALEQLKTTLINHENALATLIADLEMNQEYIRSINKSLTDTKESLRKYKDIEKLQQLGSQEKFKFIEDTCPTCDQSIKNTLLPTVLERKTLTIDDNIKYLEKTQTVFESLVKSERLKYERKEIAVNLANGKVKALRSEIKALQRSLLSPVDAEIRELIRKEVGLEKDIDNLVTLTQFENDKKDTLNAVLVDWGSNNAKLNNLPYDGFSYKDRFKIKTLKDSFKSNLKDFGYRSTPINDFDLSTNSYKPTLDDVDIGSEASASDNIRVIWSYLYSLLMLDVVAENISTNHLGLLIMDEPRQQETKDVSFKTFMKKASKSHIKGKQIIIGTSEKYEDLINMLNGLVANMLHFDSSIIRKLNKAE